MSARDPNDPFGDGWGVVVLVIAGAVATLLLMWAFDGSPS